MGTWWTLTEEQRLVRAEILKRAREAKRLKREGKQPTLTKSFLVTEQANGRAHTGILDRLLKPKSKGASFLVAEPPQSSAKPLTFLVSDRVIQKKK
jgi:hypothetical protein